MATIWFVLVAVMVAMYVLLDGFDLGAGAIHLLVARTNEERRQVIATIGPVWDGNEVWLLAAGGCLYFAFPALYASGFSGFYLPLMIVLWLLILRGTAVEFRNHIQSPIWIPFWDVVFFLSSLLLAVFFGAALGNVVRGVPLDATGYFFEPLWTNFRLSDHTGILDWFTILVGVQALLALMMHGGLWVQLKTHGAISERAGKVAGTVWWGVLLMTAVVTGATFVIQPQVIANFHTWPAGYVLPLHRRCRLRRCQIRIASQERAQRFPGLLRLFPGHAHQRRIRCLSDGSAREESGLFAHRAKCQGRRTYGLKIGLIWWVIGMALATVYFVYVYRSFAGKVSETPDSPGQGD